MFPLAHIHVSTKVTKRKDPLLVFGSILPDIAWTSSSEVDWEKIHNSPQAFSDYILKNSPEFADVALGVKLHSPVGKGADFYSDDRKTGFAMVEGRKIEEKVAAMLKEEKGEMTWVQSHSFIEIAVDLFLKEKIPEVLNLYKKSVEHVDKKAISKALEKYLGISAEVINNEIENFLRLIGPSTYVSEDILVQKMVYAIRVRRGKDVEASEVKELVVASKNLMKDKYNNYLEWAIEGVTRDFSDLI